MSLNEKITQLKSALYAQPDIKSIRKVTNVAVAGVDLCFKYTPSEAILTKRAIRAAAAEVILSKERIRRHEQRLKRNSNRNYAPNV